MAAETQVGPNASSTRYGLHGLIVESELPLDAPPANGDPDYRFRLAAPRPTSGPPAGALIGELHYGGLSFWCAESPDRPDTWVLRYLNLGDIEFDRRSRELTVSPIPGQDVGVLGALIGGSVLALILSAEHEMVIHASAVALGGSVLAIAGASGAGKTTIAALLCAHGTRLVSDDALRIVPAEEHRCYPGTNTLRLRPGAAELAATIRGAVPAPTADGRTGVSPPRPPEDAELRLAAVLVPRAAHDTNTLEIERLSAKDGLIELARNPRVISWREPGPLRAYFEAASWLASTVPIYRAKIPWGPPFTPGLAGEILAGVGFPESSPKAPR